MVTDIDGMKIHYISECKSEKADTIIILHGWGCDAEVYRAVIDFLSPFFRVVVPDLPGFGKSSEPPTAFGVGDYTDFVIKFCNSLGISKFSIIGHSLGGRIAIKLLSIPVCPFKISKVVLTGAAGIKPKRGLKAKLRILSYKAGRRILERFNPEKVEEYRKKHGSADYNAASPVMRRSLVKIVNEDLKPLLYRVRQDVLLIWGDADTETPLADGKTMEKLMPAAGLAVIKGAGHYAFLEQTKLFLDILKSYFLEDNQ